MKNSMYISKSISSRVLLSATISLLIFCLEDLSTFDSGVLKSPTIIVLLSKSFLNLLRLALCPIMWSNFENISCTLERMCILLLWDEKLYIYQLSPFPLGYC